MRQEVYRKASERADSEFNELIGEMERLRLRREQVEKALEALKSFVDLQAPVIPVEPQADAELLTPVISTEPQIEVDLLTPAIPVAPQVEDTEPEPVLSVQQIQPAPDPVPSPVQSAAAQSSDPLQRLIDDAIWGRDKKPSGDLQAA
jgi:hypothetical protein